MIKRIETYTYALAAALAMLSLDFRSPLSDSDVLWSMATGKWITLHKAFPVVDSFSWTINGKEWLTHEWLYCIGAYHMFSGCGIFGLYALSFIPILGTIYLLYLIGKKCDTNESYAFLLTLTIGLLLLYKLCIPFRAYIFALFFFTILIYLMYFKEENRLDGLYYLMLFSMWANFHISVCMGIGILFIEMMRRALVYNKYSGLVILLTSLLATLINPYTYKIWTYFWFTLTSMGESRAISEWQAPNFDNVNLLAAYLAMAASIILWQFHYREDATEDIFSRKRLIDDGCVSPASAGNSTVVGLRIKFLNFAQRNFDNYTCLLVLFWGFYIYSLYSIRMIFYAVILWIVVAGFYIGKHRKFDFTLKTYWIFTGLLLAFFAGNLLTANPGAKSIFDYNYEITPVAEVQFIKANPKYQDHLYNNYVLGGYLIWNEIPVFIDARSDSYIKFGTFNTYKRIALLSEDPQKLLDKTNVNNIIELKDSPLNWYLAVNPQWQLVYEGQKACIYTRIPKFSGKQ